MKRVLVADDTKNIRNLITTCLELDGYEVLSAKDGQEAFDLIQNEKIDLAFLDIKMPVMSGTEVLRRIRAAGIMIPIVIMTAFATVKNAVDCTKLGAVAYLQKPFTADKINNLLEEMKNYEDCSKLEEPNIRTAEQMIAAERYNDAYEELKKALSINPTNEHIYYLIGVVYSKKGEEDMARKFFGAANNFQ